MLCYILAKRPLRRVDPGSTGTVVWRWLPAVGDDPADHMPVVAELRDDQGDDVGPRSDDSANGGRR
jgi:hypothetical protein